MFPGDEVFISAVLRLRKVFNIHKKNCQLRGGHRAKFMVCVCVESGGVDNAQYIITPCRFPLHVYVQFLSYYTHTCTNIYTSHLNCSARTLSRSIGAQSLTTDIILIAHRGRAVCPHSHPDSLCAEKRTTENSGLRVSEGLRTVVSVHRVSPKSVLLLHTPGAWEQFNCFFLFFVFFEECEPRG